jgi:SAM-dependent methyltransferase
LRIEARIRLAYYPLPLAEAERIRQHLKLTPGFGALDPCIGEGHALAAITAGAQGHRCGIELDAYRAEQASTRAHEVVYASTFDVHCPVDSVSLLYLNPPYDFEISEGKNDRMERVFLQHTYRWLKPGGVLVLVIPCARLADCGEILAWNFKEVTLYALTEPESVKYDQIVLFGVRRTRRERERLQDRDISRERMEYYRNSRALEDLRELHPLTASPVRTYAVPVAEPVTLTGRGLPLDEIEDLLPKSAAYRQASRVLLAPPNRVEGRPLTPLHPGHLALLAVSSLLDGIFGSGESRHISAWRSVKVTDSSEEVEEDGTIVQRERERLANELTLVFASGKTAILR